MKLEEKLKKNIHKYLKNMVTGFITQKQKKVKNTQF